VLTLKALASARRPPIAIIVLAFLAGTLLLQTCATLPSPLWLLLLAPAALAACRDRRFLPLLFVLLGASWAGIRAQIILADALPATLEGRTLELSGTVGSIPRPLAYGSRFVFRVKRARAGPSVVTVPRRIRLTAPRRLDPGVGESWHFRARLKRPHGYENPGGFDYEASLFQHRIRAVGYALDGQKSARATPGKGIAGIRQTLATRMAGLAGDRADGGVLAALVTGDRGRISSRQWNLFRATGTSHLMAISGLHIGMVAGLVYLLASLMWRYLALASTLWPTARAAPIPALCAALLYGLLSGLSLPTQRALVMLVIVLGGQILGVRYRPTVVLGTAMLAVLLWDPLSVLAPGFWLSFVAVAAIYGVIRVQPGPRGLVPGLIRMQAILALSLAPLSLLWFQQVSLTAPVANLVAVPLFALIVVPGALLAAASELFLSHALAAHLVSLLCQCLDLLWRLLEWLAQVPPWSHGGPGFWGLVSAFAGVGLLLFPRPFPGRWLAIPWLLPLFFWHPPGPGPGETDVCLLDVGQGLSAVVRTRDHVLVFDTGPRYASGFDTGRAVVVPYLRFIGVARVDRMIISHGDNDHIGGARSVRSLLPVDGVLSSVPGRLPGARPCRAGDHWQWDGVQFRILSPPPDRPMAHNNRSCVLQVRGPYGSILLPADIEKDRERELVARVGAGLRSDVLVAAHHGSRTSSTPEFVDAVMPGLVLFPAGYRNRYGHPHPGVVARLRARGIRLMGTAASGAISIRFRADGRDVTQYRLDHARYWFDRPAFAQPRRSATLAPDLKPR
jgi:competence protein ComEC